MKKNISRMILTAVLALMSVGTWAQGRVAIATLQNGTITVGEVAATGNDLKMRKIGAELL